MGANQLEESIANSTSVKLTDFLASLSTSPAKK